MYITYEADLVNLSHQYFLRAIDNILDEYCRSPLFEKFHHLQSSISRDFDAVGDIDVSRMVWLPGHQEINYAYVSNLISRLEELAKLYADTTSVDIPWVADDLQSSIQTLLIILRHING